MMSLKSTNNDLRKENESVKADIVIMKNVIKGLEAKCEDHEKHLNGIEQYLRVNNLEIVGLPPPVEGLLSKIP